LHVPGADAVSSARLPLSFQQEAFQKQEGGHDSITVPALLFLAIFLQLESV